MSWTIYALGDLPMFNQVLNAVSMVFGSGLFTGPGVLGTGGVITVGLLISLLMVLANTMIAQATGGGSRFNFASMLMAVIILSTFMIKTTVVLEDVYTGRISPIANVPIGVAIPASIVSTLTRGVSKNFEQRFSTTQGNYVTLGDQGFVNPIQLLASLRGAVLVANESLTKTFMVAYRDCALWNISADELKRSTRPFEYVIEAMGTGLTMYYSPRFPKGTPAACAQVKNQLPIDLAATVNATDSSNGGGAAKLARRGSVTLPIGDAPAGDPTWTGGRDYGRLATIADINKAGSVLVPASSSNTNAPESFLDSAAGKALYTSPLVRVAARCANAGIDAKTYEECASTMMNDATRMYTVQLAGEASVFTKMVVPSMNMLMAMFFAFAPLVVLVFAVSGPNSIGILGKYLMFGVWTQSWLPMASVINYLIQIYVANDIGSIIAGDAMSVTLASTEGIYDALDRKLTVAFSMLSSVPFISMAVLSGSYMGLTKVADRMTGAGAGQAMDTKMAERASFSNAPMHTNLADTSYDRGHGTSVAGAASMAPVLSIGQVAGAVSQAAVQEQKSLTQTAQAQRTAEIVKGWSKDEAVQAYNKFAEADTNTHGKGFRSTGQKAVEYLKSKGVSEDNAKAIVAKHEALTTLGVDAGLSTGGELKKFANFGGTWSNKTSDGTAASQSNQIKTSDQVQEAIRTLNSLASESSNDWKHSLGTDKGKMAVNTLSEKLSGSDKEAFSNTMSAIATTSQTRSKAESLASNYGSSAQVQAPVLANQIDNAEASFIQKAVSDNKLGDKAEMLRQQYSRNFDPKTAHRMANIVALNNDMYREGSSAGAALLDVMQRHTGLASAAPKTAPQAPDSARVEQAMKTADGMSAAGDDLTQKPVAKPGEAATARGRAERGETPSTPNTPTGAPRFYSQDAGAGRGPGPHSPGIGPGEVFAEVVPPAPNAAGLGVFMRENKDAVAAEAENKQNKGPVLKQTQNDVEMMNNNVSGVIGTVGTFINHPDLMFKKPVRSKHPNQPAPVPPSLPNSHKPQAPQTQDHTPPAAPFKIKPRGGNDGLPG